MFAEIITIGDELVNGHIIDSNAAWISNQLNEVGVEVRYMTSVGDTLQDIIEAFEIAGKRAGLVVTTGGLGPTKDDITREAICRYFNCGLVQDKKVLNHLEIMYSQRGKVLNELNVKQADVPEVATVLQNRVGTAPGYQIMQNDTRFIVMPGVPFEMKKIFAEQVLPGLQTDYNLAEIEHTYLHTVGMAESSLALAISDIEENLPEGVKLAYKAGPARVSLRLTYLQKDRGKVEQIVGSLGKILGKKIFGYDDDTLEGRIGTLLKARKETLATAESCTGGLIAHKITSVPGSSVYFAGGIISYSNDIKTGLLNVDEKTLQQHGAVSEATVKEMVQGALSVLGTDYAIAVSGIAGPDGGSPDKPVGTTWIAVGNRSETIAKKFLFNKIRDVNIELSAVYALNLLRISFLEKN